MVNKKCKKCHKTKPLNDFFRSGKYYSSLCKECKGEYMEKYRAEKSYEIKSQRNEYMINYRDKNQLRIDLYYKSLQGRFGMWRRSAKSRDIKWDITMADILKMPMQCFYTKLDLTLEKDKLNTVSIDRINNSKPYTKDNIVLCCHYVNIMKNKFKLSDFLDICKLISENYDNIKQYGEA